MGSFVQIHFCLAEGVQIADRVMVLEVLLERAQGTRTACAFSMPRRG
jgi:hypothetical protein